MTALRSYTPTKKGNDMSTISYYRGQEIDRLKTVNYRQAQEIDRLKTVNRQHLMDRAQILSTNEVLGNELSSALIDINTLNIELYGRPSKPR